MTSDRLCLDTTFVQARLNKRDQYHTRANAFALRLRTAAEVWTTEAVLVEIGNALSNYSWGEAAQFIRRCYATPNMHVVSVNTGLLERALQLYAARSDKEWGLTDCISFVVMQDQQLVNAVTTDRHFQQAGFRVLLIET